MTRLHPRLTAAVCLVAFGLAGCSAAGSTTAAPPAASAPKRHVKHHVNHHVDPRRPRRPRRTRQHRTPRPASQGPVLAPSTASGTRIQPQPAPGSCHARGAGRFVLPDRRCTPGAIDPRVRQSDIQTTICRVGYTATVRPPESITEPEKESSLRAYGDTLPLHDYEYDHLVPLELSGAPNDPRNLWPEPGGTPNPKDSLENRLRELVCERAITLATAQQEIARNWIAAYRRLIG